MHEEAFELSRLISGYLLCTLTTEEEERLFTLLEEDKERYKLLEQYRSAKSIQNRLGYINALDVDKAWSNINERSSATKKSSLNRSFILKYAAIFAIILGITFVYINNSKTDPKIITDVTRKYKNDVLPATQNARLILSNGEEIELDTTDHHYADEQGLTITSKNGNLYYTNTKSAGNEKQAQYNRLIVPKAGTYALQLADGTKVILNAMSELKFPVSFNESERKVILQGEAYFEVAKDVKRPFKVELNGSEVKVLGTHFNISCYGATAITTLLEGSVSIQNSKSSAVLVPGKQSISSLSSIKVLDGDIDKAVAWKNGDFYFSNDDLETALTEIGRWYDLQLIYKTPIPKMHIGGHISRKAKLSEVLEMLKDITKLSYNIEDRKLIIDK